MNWLELWESEDYREIKNNNFKTIDNFINFNPKRILDIGCGFAFESEMFQKKYNSELFLLDSNNDNTETNRQVNYGKVDDFSFYNKVNDLEESFNERNLKYTFLDFKNLLINDDTKFDLIYSFLSCGFHYPASTYKNIINKHSNKDTVIILDLRKKSIEEQQHDINIIKIIYESSKHITAQITYR